MVAAGQLWLDGSYTSIYVTKRHLRSPTVQNTSPLDCPMGAEELPMTYLLQTQITACPPAEMLSGQTD